MRRRRIGLRFLIVFLAAATLQAAAPDNRAAFEAARRRALEVRGALLPKAAPSARAKIAGSAQASRAYLAGCRQSCDLYGFLSMDLRARFTRLSEKELDLLVVLVFAETVDAGSEVRRELSIAYDRSQKFIGTLSNIMAKIQTTDDSIVQNMR
ncbi:MAG TPA: hypothetical protein VMT19_00990 [Thermoanaerobaculaceae bacterium]|nr:hypothetical protein [Thermoanaerobaculaceae bacterium]